jgi:hypothetical protein
LGICYVFPTQDIIPLFYGGTFTFSNCHIIGLDTVGLVFLVSGYIPQGTPVLADASLSDASETNKEKASKSISIITRFGLLSI